MREINFNTYVRISEEENDRGIISVRDIFFYYNPAIWMNKEAEKQQEKRVAFFKNRNLIVEVQNFNLIKKYYDNFNAIEGRYLVTRDIIERVFFKLRDFFYCVLCGYYVHNEVDFNTSIIQSFELIFLIAEDLFWSIEECISYEDYPANCKEYIDEAFYSCFPELYLLDGVLHAYPKKHNEEINRKQFKFKFDKKKAIEDKLGEEEWYEKFIAIFQPPKTIAIYEGREYYSNTDGFLSFNNKNVYDINEIAWKRHPQMLIYLDLSNNNISKIYSLEKLSNLKKLNLSRNKISIISGLNSLANLEMLDLENNNITDLSGLKNLSNLKDLNLAKNNIQTIEGLDDLKKLESLNMSENKINEILGFENLKNLRTLNLKCNNISKIDGSKLSKRIKNVDL